MKLVDAHVHLSDTEYVGHIDELIADAKNAGISALMTNSMDFKTCKNDIGWQKQYPDLVYPALGIHPWNVNVLGENELEQTIEFIQQHKGMVKAIGEIGLDYKYETVWEKQILVFDSMLHLAETLDLPVIIHSRGTTDKIVDMLPSYRVKQSAASLVQPPYDRTLQGSGQRLFHHGRPPCNLLKRHPRSRRASAAYKLFNRNRWPRHLLETPLQRTIN